LNTDKIYYKRNLPHYQPDGYTYFVTFRIAGTLPAIIIDELKKEYKSCLDDISSLKIHKEKSIKYTQIKWDYFEKFDQQLDLLSNKNLWLKDNRIAKIVSDSILFRDKKEYDLICYCIMPNHVHMVFYIVERTACSLNENVNERSGRSLYKIMQSLKSYTANECNKILKRTGSFWQHESYDHVVRNDEELNRIIEYVLNNPLKANIIDNVNEWKWSYCKYL
jgi:REP element-mobilizing transposase RayT